MTSFNSKDFIDQLKNDFNSIDTRIQAFKDKLLQLIENELQNLSYVYAITKDKTANIDVFGDEIWNGVDSVIYKDQSYPEYRLQEEVEVMQKIISKRKTGLDDQKNIEKIHSRVKKMVVEEFSIIEKLSAHGFRLLETYTLLYCQDFYFKINNAEKLPGFQL